MINRKAFTLIELSIVLLIISVLTLTARNYYLDGIQQAREATVKQNLKTIRTALGNYFKREMSYPTKFSLLPLNGTVEAMTIRILQEPNTKLVLTIPNLAANASPNAYLATVTTDVTLNPGEENTALFDQFREIKISRDGQILPW